MSPGSVSDSYDPEWGTVSNGQKVVDAMEGIYHTLSLILNESPPMYILDLVEENLSEPITATLTEKEWRLLRFAVELSLGLIKCLPVRIVLPQ